MSRRFVGSLMRGALKISFLAHNYAAETKAATLVHRVMRLGCGVPRLFATGKEVRVFTLPDGQRRKQGPVREDDSNAATPLNQ